jgi:FKBP-type peptidyl-prolyl cis-trans isomerase FkpA
MMKWQMLMLSLFLVVSCNSGQNAADFKLNDDNDKTFYTMGIMLGSNLQRLELSDKEIQALYKGLKDSAQGKEPEVNVSEYQPKIQEMFKQRMEKVTGDQKKIGEDFMNKFKAEEGVKVTESGLAYKVIKEGTGKSPKAEDVVEVHYHGTLPDGTVFDSSVERGKTVSFPLNRVIKGWTEGVQLMKEGAKYRFVIPSELAYGDAGAPPKIPGGSTLAFDVELFKINAPEKKEAPKKKK